MSGSTPERAALRAAFSSDASMIRGVHGDTGMHVEFGTGRGYRGNKRRRFADNVVGVREARERLAQQKHREKTGAQIKRLAKNLEKSVVNKTGPRVSRHIQRKITEKTAQ